MNFDRRLKQSNLLAASIFLGMTLISLWPLPLHIFSRLPLLPLDAKVMTVPGDGDPYMFCWNLWWVKGWILNQHPLLFTNLIHHPFGVTLAGHTLSIANGLLAFPLIDLAGVTGAYNLLLILHALVTGWAVFRIILELNGSVLGGLIGGEISIFWPARIIHGLAHLNFAATSWIPLFILFMLYAIRRRNRIYILAAALALAAAGATDWHYLLFLGIISPFILLMPSNRTLLARILHLAIPWIIAGILLIPLAKPLLDGKSGIEARDQEEREKFSIRIASLFIPSPVNPLWKNAVGDYYDRLPGNVVESVGYLGVVPLILLIAGLLFGNPVCRIWMSATILLILLALGPTLFMDDKSIRMPYRLLELIPGIDLARTPGRFMIPAGMTIAIGAGISFSLLKRFWRSERICGIVVSLLILLDFLPLPVPLAQASIPGIYNEIRREPHYSKETTALMEIPSHWNIRLPQFYQTAHGIPITSGFVSRIPDEIFARSNEFPHLKALSDPLQVDSVLQTAKRFEIWDLLNLLKVDGVVLHRDWIPNGISLNPVELADLFHGAVAADDGERILVHVDLASEPPDSSAARLYYYREWFAREIWPTSMTPVRWVNGTRATLCFFVPPETNQVFFSFKALPAQLHDPMPQEITLEYRGRDVLHSKFVTGTEWTFFSGAIAGPFDPNGEMLILKARDSASPCDFKDNPSTDRRNLSVAVTDFEIIN
jgi:hypothetical protein